MYPSELFWFRNFVRSHLPSAQKVLIAAERDRSAGSNESTEELVIHCLEQIRCQDSLFQVELESPVLVLNFVKLSPACTRSIQSHIASAFTQIGRSVRPLDRDIVLPFPGLN